MRKAITLLLFGTLLSGCNISLFGSDGNKQLEFTDSNVEVFIDQSVTNPLTTSPKFGEVEWQSSNPSVATIDAETGAIQLLDDGQTEIHAGVFINGIDSENTASYVLMVSKYPQDEIAFNFDDLVLIKGTEFSNNAIQGVKDDARIIYQSMDDTVATTEALSGQLTAGEIGDTAIDVTIHETALYEETLISYDVAIRNGITGLQLSIGENDTLIEWESIDTDLTLWLTSSNDCTPTALENCENLQSYQLPSESPNSMNIDATDLTNTGLAFIQGPNFISSGIAINPVNQPFGGRRMAGFAAVDNRLVFFGGLKYTKTGLEDRESSYDDIWTSSDGISWQSSSSSFPTGNRYDMNVVNFADGIISIGGTDLPSGESIGENIDDVWSSSNGEVWQFVAEDIPFWANRSNATVFNDKIWVLAETHNFEASLWSSPDGKDWQFESRVPESAAVINGKLSAFKEQLYVLLGQDGNSNESRVIWRTSDGSSWEIAADFTEDPHRRLMSHWSTTVFKDKLFIFAGALSQGQSDNMIFSSEDGETFQRHEQFTSPFMGIWQQFAELDNKLLMFTHSGLANIWQSEDGIKWRTPIDAGIQWQYP